MQGLYITLFSWLCCILYSNLNLCTAQIIPLTQAQREAMMAWPKVKPTDTIQKDIRDSALHLIHYDHRYRPVSGDRQEQYIWSETLQLGRSYQRYVDTRELWRDSIWDVMVRSGKQHTEIYPIWSSDDPRPHAADAQLFNLLTDTLEHRDNIFIDKYRYREAIPRQQWQLTSGDSVVAGYPCHRAVTHWRGRDYVAWYTEELPLSYGPYKFRGLPGLIVCIYDSKGDHHWSLTSFETEAKPQYIYRKLGKMEFTTKRSTFLKMKKRYAEHPDVYTSSAIISKGPQKKRKPLPYNPIELE